jgi:serine/threonine protein kinase
LYQAIKQRSRLTISETIEISEQISKGLLEAHKARILHRDINTSNVLVDAKLTLAKITDLGVSALLREGEAAHTMTGTLSYMAPEIVRGEGGFYSDIYSLCVTMYEMVTGELPIKGSSIEELVHNIQTLVPKPPSELRPDIPLELNELILKGLEKDISKRFKTIEEMLIAIQRLKSPQDFSKDIAKAWMVFRSGDIVASKNLFREVLKKYPHEVECYLNVAEFYNRCEDYDLSIRVLKKGLDYHPRSAALHWNLAMVYSQKKMGKEAVSMLERALELGVTSKQQSQGKLLVELWKKTI